jgi:hypothetical protein
MVSLKGSSREPLAGKGLRGDGIGEVSACWMVRRCTPCRSASERIDQPLRCASRRMAANGARLVPARRPGWVGCPRDRRGGAAGWAVNARCRASGCRSARTASQSRLSVVLRCLQGLAGSGGGRWGVDGWRGPGAAGRRVRSRRESDVAGSAADAVGAGRRRRWRSFLRAGLAGEQAELCQRSWTVLGWLCRLAVLELGERFGWGSVAEAGVQPLPVVEHFDVVGDGEPGAGPGGERVPVVHLVLQGAEERLGGGVVPADPGASQAGPNLVPGAVPDELGGGVPGAPRSEWNTAPGRTWPCTMAMPSASRTSDVRMWSASCHPERCGQVRRYACVATPAPPADERRPGFGPRSGSHGRSTTRSFRPGPACVRTRSPRH